MKWPPVLDYLVMGAVLAFIVLISLFPIRNNDIWWHLAVGKELVQSHSFITVDPFMFSVPGLPWVPHAWLAGLLFYGVYSVAGVAGLVLMRVVLVAATFGVCAVVLRRLNVSLTLSAPFMLLVALSAHPRFIARPHLFEYLFVVLIVGYLCLARYRRSRRYLLWPVLLQVLWVNLHASFYMGVILTGAFFAGEWMSIRLARPMGTQGILEARPPTRVLLLLIVLLVLASFVNPRPIEFVVQPLSAEQRDLLTRYNLEWKSPFDPELRHASFRPYYELTVAFGVLAFLLSWGRWRLSSLLIVGLFMVASFKAHRFRVEFGLVALILGMEQLKASPWVQRAGSRLAASGAGWGVRLAAVAACVVLVATARDKIHVSTTVSDRYPGRAFQVMREADVAHRPFHTIGFGSYLLWDLFPERQSFIDGRNIDAGLYTDFLACQSHSAGFNGTIRKYDLDAFIIPTPELSDAGMRNVHNFLIESRGWSLVHMDHVAYLYVKNNRAPGEWLSENRFRFYHPLTMANLRFSAAQKDSVEAELRRAADMDEAYVRPRLDLARFYAVIGQNAAARAAVNRVLRVEPENAEAESILERLQ